MPKGPQGQKRPSDTVANAIRVAKILTGEVEEDMGDSGKDKAARSERRKGPCRQYDARGTDRNRTASGASALAQIRKRFVIAVDHSADLAGYRRTTSIRLRA
jgi:hypothetical protein